MCPLARLLRSFCSGIISMSLSIQVCFPPYEAPGSRRALPERRPTLTTRGWNSVIFVRSMLNDHTASKGALMMTSCLDRNGGCKILPPKRSHLGPLDNQSLVSSAIELFKDHLLFHLIDPWSMIRNARQYCRVSQPPQ